MSTDTLVGQTLGKYKIIKHLGRGGMAEVYKGYREDLDRTVAIKLMHAFLVSEQDFLFRFKREARAMARMRHPNIVTVYDFDVYGENTYYLVMEYIGGGTLKQKLTALAEKGERLPLTKVVKIALEVAEALTYAHNRNMVHRDIKPANIMLDETGKAILTDFGIVKLVGGQSMSYTATGALIGTPAYMSPEQALGKPGDGRSDLYSLGILLFQMATGQLPFSADTPLAVVMKHVNDPVPLPISFNPDVPPGLQEIILKAMAKDPKERYQSAKEMAAALRAVNLSATAPPAAVTELPSETIVSTHQPTRQDTPAASLTSVASTQVAEPVEAKTAASATAVGQTVAAPPSPQVVAKKRSPWLFAGIGLAVVILAAGAIFAAGLIPGRGAPVTPTSPIVAVVPTETPTAPPTATETLPAPTATTDAAATSAAAVVLTAEAKPTETNTPTPTATATPTRKPTKTPSATPTIDATAQFLATCVTDAELVLAYTYREATNSAPVSTNFPINWVLKNSGTCPWPVGLQWAYLEGNALGYADKPVPLETGLASGEEISLKSTLVSPASAGRFSSTWQLVDADGQSFGPPLTFEVRTYVPATATPKPPPTAAVTATPTAEAVALDWIYDISGCEYVGTEWRCLMRITPYGGGGGPYTVWVFDADQPAEYRGPGPFNHFVTSRRCASYIHEVKVQDDASGTSFSENVFVDPDNYFSGGCTMP